MEDHGLFFICSYILGSIGFLQVPSDAQENSNTENTPFIIICWHATPLQIIRRDALEFLMSATMLLYLGGRTCRRRVTTFSTVSLEAELVSITMTDLRSSIVPCKIRGKWGKTDQRGKTDHWLSGPNQRCYMLKYIPATFMLVCPSRAGHMVGLAGTVSELFVKMLFFHKTILCERSEDRKI